MDGIDTVDADLKHVELDLGDDQKFQYQMTRTEGFMGSYSLEGELLYLYTGQNESDTIIVEVMNLDEHALVLRMNHEGQERQMHLKKSP